MCGIFGYIGRKDPLKTCLAGLEQLEYRGYDSSGIAAILNKRITSCKKVGKLANLKAELTRALPFWGFKKSKENPLEDQKLDLAIGHTRWATHGKVNDENAHPHMDMQQEIAIVHNGIIENYREIKAQLIKEGVTFVSETDSEVIVQLVAKHYKGDFLAAVQTALPLLRGIYAIALIHKDHPNEIIAAARECPVAIGTDDQKTESYISSDANAFLRSGLNVIFLRDNEIAQVQKGSIKVYNAATEQITKKIQRIDSEFVAPSKEGFDHFLIKEVFEQPNTVRKAIHGRFHEETGMIDFESFNLTPEELVGYKKIWILGCGTSAHAGAMACHYLEELAKIPTSYEIGSEARFRTDLLTPDTLVIAISQSGETADTISALREVKKKGCKILGICNVKYSTLTREADACIYLKAGIEISVCSTKALTSQIAVLALFAIYMGRLRGRLTDLQAKKFFQEFKKIPDHIQHVLDKAPILERLAKKYAHYNDFFFMGRRYMYITCLEAALKLKEISYVNANGYPAGELKHGPIALISSTFPVVAFCANEQTKDKILSNLMEVKARGAPILAFAPIGMDGVDLVADDTFWLPPTIDPLAPFASTVAGQLLAYYIAKERGCDIDQPRNLAKSVTVE
jgi:glucosamine--fructose-6-phosphate aminotransferase (isomerizing)